MSEDTNLEPMVYRRGVEGGQKIFGGISNFFWKGKRGDLPKFLADEGGRVAIFFLLLSKKEALFLDFFF